MDKAENTCNITEASKALKTFDASPNEPDYYMENGLLVFTSSYHLKRGNCCKSGCRHCPYGYRRKL